MQSNETSWSIPHPETEKEQTENHKIIKVEKDLQGHWAQLLTQHHRVHH